MQVLALGLASGLIWALTSGPPYAAPDPAQLCRKAAADAARNSGVPEEVLLAITLVETGRADQPWPWTVTVDGVGHWLDSADSAEQMIEAALADGISNIDIGCFQLNYRWHANAFLSAEDMLDPEGNALYAATFLASHYDRTGDWASAAAAYHSTTPEYAEVYRARFEDRLAGLAADGGGPRAMQDRADVPNRFPLLIAGVAGARGSLVPAGTGGQRLIGGP
ncbi:MAG: hypothetical protein B7Z10_11480 [Rhodobacterales bacterium 32-66-7]|nr:MAG: hypothetical protein B7Z31_01145 [Rhodobacterales bacterium 12-65-15]OYX23312.1 MAG: hypothetical protein B7Z10_11480 [Rhodobacterales bacterium 32-66-7]